MKNNILASHDFVVHFVPEPIGFTFSTLSKKHTLCSLSLELMLCAHSICSEVAFECAHNINSKDMKVCHVRLLIALSL